VMNTNGLIEAIAYLRTSSAANVGEDKDSAKRQREAIHSYASRAGYQVVEEFYDAAVSGADPVNERQGFGDMLKRIAGNGVRTIIVETANRFARDLIVQETGWRYLQSLGVTLIAADSPDSFLDTTPTADLIRQVLGAVSQFEKAALVSKLRAARERKAKLTGQKVGGRKSVQEVSPETVALARKLARYPVNHRKRSLRDIAGELEAAGYVTSKGTRYTAMAVSRMVSGLAVVHRATH
jgi:DNA invertase Pin-like site-specific DNA recombinase